MMARWPAPSDCCSAGIFMQMRRFLLHLVFRNETCFIPAASASRAKLPGRCGGGRLSRGQSRLGSSQISCDQTRVPLKGLKNVCIFTQCVWRSLFVLARNGSYAGTAGSAFRAKLGFNVLPEDSFSCRLQAS